VISTVNKKKQEKIQYSTFTVFLITVGWQELLVIEWRLWLTELLLSNYFCTALHHFSPLLSLSNPNGAAGCQK
jgi:hypothetical protein